MLRRIANRISAQVKDSSKRNHVPKQNYDRIAKLGASVESQRHVQAPATRNKRQIRQNTFRPMNHSGHAAIGKRFRLSEEPRLRYVQAQTPVLFTSPQPAMEFSRGSEGGQSQRLFVALATFGFSQDNYSRQKRCQTNMCTHILTAGYFNFVQSHLVSGGSCLSIGHFLNNHTVWSNGENSIRR